MRLAVDATPLLGPRTGIGTFVAELLGRLAERDDLEVVAWATSWRGRGALDGALPAGIAGIARPMAARPLHELWRYLDHPHLERWTGAVDVAHGTNFVVPPTRRAARVVSVHDLTPVRFPAMSTADTLRYPALVRRAVSRGAWVHVDAPSVGEEVVAELGADAERVVAVPLAPTPVPDADPARGRAMAGSDRYVLALGTVEPRKGLPGLVRAFDAVVAQVPEAKLVVAGPDGWGADALSEAIAASPAGDRVVRTGWVSPGDRAALLRGASVLAFPSVYEGFGLPPLEAMSVGTPVVTTDAGALRDTCAEGAAVVPVGDVEALAAALVRVLTDEAEADRLRHQGRAWVSRFDWDATVDGLVDLYRRASGRDA